SWWTTRGITSSKVLFNLLFVKVEESSIEKSKIFLFYRMMNTSISKRYKQQFEQDLNGFAQNLKSIISLDNGEWSIKGFIDACKNIYTISSDTKIVSKILEIHLFPLIVSFSRKIGYKLILAEKQNWYPDLTFINEENEQVKFAVDIKTTFRRNSKTAGFTLGSHGAYFRERDKKKNIQIPYNQYSGHFCLGIIYTRMDAPETEIYQVKELKRNNIDREESFSEAPGKTVSLLKDITSVIKDFDIFAVEKWKIASDKQGSGNTANIGSVCDIEDLKNGNGVFSKLGESWFDDYWSNYGVAQIKENGKYIPVRCIKDFLKMRGRDDLLSKVNKKFMKGSLE
ncbi:MAG: type II restriction endonuclease, partial [Fibrobacter sp.]|nr:type II restriction endonuclease [Fibrobacter sp.]